ncbi:MAG: hypothetical protein WCK07_11470, partial [Betaproteobacteria bacterium]
SAGGTLTDPALELFDSAGVFVDGNDDISSSNTDSRLIYKAQTAGTYFLAARDAGDTTGTFILSASALTIAPALELAAIAAGTGGFVVNGTAADEQAGYSIAAAGDVNGDGLADFIVGAPGADPAARPDAGRSYIVFGKNSGTAVDLGAVATGSGGFVINGRLAGETSGSSVSAAGDVNGDGLADLIVAGPNGGTTASGPAGHAYIVYGKATTAAVDLATVATGSGGYVINGAAYDVIASVSSAGDINGDGFGDVVIGVTSSDPALDGNAGRAYIVFGKSTGTAVNLATIAAGTGSGFVVTGNADDLFSGRVAAAGDVNGDGTGDVLVGPWNDSSVYLVFGKRTPTPFDLATLDTGGSGGFVINGSIDMSDGNVAGVGDVNGDGLADLMIGLPHDGTTASGAEAGRSYVIFGKSSTTAVNLTTIAAGSGGFVITGEQPGDLSGWSVAAAGDVNGDGLADMIIGAPGAVPDAGIDAGISYVVFGRSATTAVNLADVALGKGGFAINSGNAGELSGSSVTAAGDLNGDGLADLLIGAPAATSAGGVAAGRVYAVFGATSGSFKMSAVDQMGGATNDVLSGTTVAETLIGGAGNDTLTGNGGADVLYGGSGDDLIVINPGNLSALAAPYGSGGNTTQLARIDGGGGVDTLKLAGAAMTLDLTTIAQQGAGDPGSRSRIESIERIDLTGSGNNTLNITAADIIDLAGMNSFNSSNGWSSLGTTARFHQLVVDGNAGDSVNLTDYDADSSLWTYTGTAINNAHNYVALLHYPSNVELLIDSTVFNSVITVPGKTIDVQAYAWKSHTLLDSVVVSAGSYTSSTNGNGATSLTGVTPSSTSISASRVVPSSETAATDAAVNLQDAIAVLKMIIGVDVNGAGKPLSPYQALAADYDGNGAVQLADALGIFQHAGGLSSPSPIWRLVNEADSAIATKANLNPGVAPASFAADLSGASAQLHVGLVGVLSGDVDGSYAGPASAPHLDVLQPTYYSDLVASHTGLSLAQFGIYP